MKFPLEKKPRPRCAILVWLAFAAFASAQEKAATPKPSTPVFGSRKNEPMVEVAQVCPSIVIDLRYATERNVTGKPIYPPNARCLVRASVAQRLKKAQEALQAKKLGLKIWDAYRPAWAQQKLWEAVRNPDYVGEPARGGSLHTYGAGVDVTLVDARGRELRMPTDFDDFTPAASRTYSGRDPVIARNLYTLQRAMVDAGFWVLKDEWWHFVSEDVKTFGPVEIALGAEPKGALEEQPTATPPAVKKPAKPLP
jgi:zinc D-Ala-D-Ala dipeptidase